jgi:predicted RNA-binding protein YlxR (DUF448 family)
LISLGFITIEEQQEMEYCTEIAKRAGRYGIAVYRFTPLDIDPLTEKVHGRAFDGKTESWVKGTFDIPSFLYDRCFYRSDIRSKKCKPIMQWLKHRPDLVFLGYGFPGKWDVYEKMIEHPLLSPYVPKTARLQSDADILRMIRREQAVICKPEHGAGGRGIYVIQKAERKLHIRDASGQTTALVEQKSELEQWTATLLQHHSYLIQPFLPLQTKANEPFDVRFLFQKDDTGKWIERCRAVRVGRPGTFIANVRAGADVCDFLEWIRSFPSSQRILIIDGIETIIRALPSYVDEQFGPLFELGIDIGITKEGGVWIIDVNSKPGRKIVAALHPDKTDDVYEAPLQYCLFLANEVNIS